MPDPITHVSISFIFARQWFREQKLLFVLAALSPDIDVAVGGAYLLQLLERFDGSVMMALAGYNAGPHRVEQWIKKYGDPRRPEVDAVDWAERIPFSETRNYVQRILETIPVYRARLGQRRAERPLDRDTASRYRID